MPRPIPTNRRVPEFNGAAHVPGATRLAFVDLRFDRAVSLYICVALDRKGKDIDYPTYAADRAEAADGIREKMLYVAQSAAPGSELRARAETWCLDAMAGGLVDLRDADPGTL